MTMPTRSIWYRGCQIQRRAPQIEPTVFLARASAVRHARELCKASMICRRRQTRDLPEGSGENAGFAEPEFQPDFGHRMSPLVEQSLGSFDAPIAVIAVRWHA